MAEKGTNVVVCYLSLPDECGDAGGRAESEAADEEGLSEGGEEDDGRGVQQSQPTHHCQANEPEPATPHSGTLLTNHPI